MQPESAHWKGIHSRQFRDWVRTCASVPHSRQSPADELLAEHHLAAGVILAMEEGADRLLHGSPIRGFWRRTVEFIGNFMHLVHRTKETHCFSAVVGAGVLPLAESVTLQQEHDDAKQTTLELIDTVEAGDWKGAYRHVAYYAHVMRPHMEHEEQTLIRAVNSVDPRTQAALSAAFQQVEATVMRGRSRKYYLDLARQMCSETGVEHPL